MTRRTWFFLGLSGACGCRRETTRRLNVFNWSSYVAPETIPNFEREFGIRVRYGVYESNEELLARVMSGNSGWDVAFPTGYLVGPMRDLGLLAPADRRLLPNLANLAPEFASPEWDRDLRWCVPYMWGASGIVYNTREAPEISEWAGLWDADLQGRITMLDDPVDVFAACLKKLSHSINTRSHAELREAQQEALDQKELLRAYLNAEVRDQLVAGDVLAAQLWSTTSQQAIEAASHLRFVYPEEGFALYADNAVILRESRRTGFAHEFINYLLRPEVAAAIATATQTATVNSGARALVKKNETLYPDSETLARGEWSASATPDVQRLRDRLWTEIKSA